MPENGLIRKSWRAISKPPSIEAPMKIKAAMKCQKTSLSSTRSSWRGSSFSKVVSSLCSRSANEKKKSLDPTARQARAPSPRLVQAAGSVSRW